MELDDRQIAFITCVNDEEEYAECRHYLERLYIPEGYGIDIIAIREAPSMAVGYNAGMHSSAARYKVYLHQDVFIKNIGFIKDMLAVFAADGQIGLLGMVGNRSTVTGVGAITAWDTGKVMDNIRQVWGYESLLEKEQFMEVWAADGLLLATQYDIFWREDIFEGWDFYDISQSMEFKKAGYKVVIPFQKEAWCYHDCAVYPKVGGYYDDYKRFMWEYSSLEGFPVQDQHPITYPYEAEKRFAQDIIDARRTIQEFLCVGDKMGVRRLFQEPSVKGMVFLKDLESIVCIDQQEEEGQSEKIFWESGMSFEGLISKQRDLKYALKRIEYEDDPLKIEHIKDHYSKYAVIDICERYVIEKSKVYNALEGCLGKGWPM